MSPSVLRVAVWVGCLQALAASAGEIVILQPAPAEGQVRPERGSERAMDKARQQAGKAKKTTTVILGEDGVQVPPVDQAEESAQDARDHVRPAGSMAAEGGTIIIRSVPVSDSERARQRARSYIVPPPAPAVARTGDCNASVSSQVGTIGEGAGATRGNVVERGTSSVNVQAHCR